MVGDVVGDALRLGEELLRSALIDCSSCGQRRIGQARQVLRLVDQHGRLVLQALDLVVDLLQLARRGQHVLREVGRVEDDPLRVRRTRSRSRAASSGDAGGERRAKATMCSW